MCLVKVHTLENNPDDPVQLESLVHSSTLAKKILFSLKYSLRISLVPQGLGIGKFDQWNVRLTVYKAIIRKVQKCMWLYKFFFFCFKEVI